MVKYKITKDGLKKHILNKIRNSNKVSVEEKMLAILNSGLGYTPSSLYGCVKEDEAIKQKTIVSQGTVDKVLSIMVQDKLIESYNDSEMIGGDK